MRREFQTSCSTQCECACFEYLHVYLPDISAAEVTRIAEYYHTNCSCVIKTLEPRKRATERDLKAVVAKVQALEGGYIAPWDEELIPDSIVDKLPTSGYNLFTSHCTSSF